jgi:protein-tyrosine phosphatase
MPTLMTVCLGNLCRSPYAEALLAQALPQWRVLSAGLAARPGDPADELTRKFAAAQGLDLSAHRAQPISAILCQQAELILVMEKLQKNALERQYPAVRGKVYRLGEWIDRDIEDPYRQAETVHEQTYSMIAQAVSAWLPRLQKF